MKYIRIESKFLEFARQSVWYKDTPENRAKLEASVLFKNTHFCNDSHWVAERDIVVPVSPVQDHSFAIEYPVQSVDPSQGSIVVETPEGNIYHDSLIVNRTNLDKYIEDGRIGIGVMYTDDPILDGGAYYAYMWDADDKTTHTIEITGLAMLSRNEENEDPHLYRQVPVDHDKLYFEVSIVDWHSDGYSFALGRNDKLILSIDIRTTEEIDQLIAQGQLTSNKIIAGKRPA